MADEQRNLAIVARLGQLWNAGDHEAVLALYHDDIVMTASPLASDARTPGGGLQL